jgi:hypothetical protein
MLFRQRSAGRQTKMPASLRQSPPEPIRPRGLRPRPRRLSRPVLGPGRHRVPAPRPPQRPKSDRAVSGPGFDCDPSNGSGPRRRPLFVSGSVPPGRPALGRPSPACGRPVPPRHRPASPVSRDHGRVRVLAGGGPGSSSGPGRCGHPVVGLDSVDSHRRAGVGAASGRPQSSADWTASVIDNSITR